MADMLTLPSITQHTVKKSFISKNSIKKNYKTAIASMLTLADTAKHSMKKALVSKKWNSLKT